MLILLVLYSLLIITVDILFHYACATSRSIHGHVYSSIFNQNMGHESQLLPWDPVFNNWQAQAKSIRLGPFHAFSMRRAFTKASVEQNEPRIPFFSYADADVIRKWDPRPAVTSFWITTTEGLETDREMVEGGRIAWIGMTDGSMIHYPIVFNREQKSTRNARQDLLSPLEQSKTYQFSDRQSAVDIPHESHDLRELKQSLLSDYLASTASSATAAAANRFVNWTDEELAVLNAICPIPQLDPSKFKTSTAKSKATNSADSLNEPENQSTGSLLPKSPSQPAYFTPTATALARLWPLRTASPHNIKDDSEHVIDLVDETETQFTSDEEETPTQRPTLVTGESSSSKKPPALKRSKRGFR